MQRSGWRVAYDQSAIAWTEAPQSFHQLARQRFRWAFGTIQCVWKHKGIIANGRPRGLAFVGLPQTILFQLLFALISPIIDLALVVNIFWTVSSIQEHGYTAMKGDLYQVALFWIIFAAIDLTAGLIAFALERREDWRLIGWLHGPALRLPTDHVLRRHQGRSAGTSRATRGLVIHRAIRESCSRRSCTLTLSRGCPHVSGTLPRLAFQIDTDMSAHRTRGNPQKKLANCRDMA